MGHVKSQKKVGLDRFSRFDVYWIQTNKHTSKESITLPFLNPYRILTPSLYSSIPIYPSPFPFSIPILSFPLPFLNPYCILPPSLPQSLYYPSPFLNPYSILPPSLPKSLFNPSPFPSSIPILSITHPLLNPY